MHRTLSHHALAHVRRDEREHLERAHGAHHVAQDRRAQQRLERRVRPVAQPERWVGQSCEPRLLGARRNLGEARHALVHPASGAPRAHARLDPPDHPAHEAHPPHGLTLSSRCGQLGRRLPAPAERLPATRDALHELCSRMQLGDRGEVCESAQPTGECAGGSRARHTLHHRGGTLPARALGDQPTASVVRSCAACRRLQRHDGASDTARKTAREAAARCALHACRTRAREAQPAPCHAHPPASGEPRRCHRPRREHHAQPCATEGGLQPRRRPQPHRADRHRLRRQHLAQPHRHLTTHGGLQRGCGAACAAEGAARTAAAGSGREGGGSGAGGREAAARDQAACGGGEGDGGLELGPPLCRRRTLEIAQLDRCETARSRLHDCRRVDRRRERIARRPPAHVGLNASGSLEARRCQPLSRRPRNRREGRSARRRAPAAL